MYMNQLASSLQPLQQLWLGLQHAASLRCELGGQQLQANHISFQSQLLYTQHPVVVASGVESAADGMQRTWSY